jgi:hypothetical protein
LTFHKKAITNHISAHFDRLSELNSSLSLSKRAEKAQKLIFGKTSTHPN